MAKPLSCSRLPSGALLMKLLVCALVVFVCYQNFTFNKLYKRVIQETEDMNGDGSEETHKKSKPAIDKADSSKLAATVDDSENCTSPECKEAKQKSKALEASSSSALAKITPIPKLDSFYTPKSTKFGVITYVPHKPNNYYLIQFVAILYSSWRYVIEHPWIARSMKIRSYEPLKDLIIADLLVYCARDACKQMPEDCSQFNESDVKLLTALAKSPRTPRCLYFVAEEHGYAAQYGYTNSFIFAGRSDFLALTPIYSYMIRLDTDCLLSPAFLAFYPKDDREVLHGTGAYCTQFNAQRLEQIAAKLNLRNQGIHCIGSSFYAKPKLMSDIGELTINLTIHIASNEFNKTLPGIEHLVKNNPAGEWPTWYRGVSLLYATELAINDAAENVTDSRVEGILDQNTCYRYPVTQAVALHCYQNACQFRKFDFMDSVINVLKLRLLDPRLFTFYDDRDATNMTFKSYAIFVAWHGSAHYLKHIKAWTASALGRCHGQICE